jgi:predicted GH43/DUF377 family glycosyl hydrolase
MFSWKKKGLVFSPSILSNRPEWMSEFAQAPATLVFDKFVRVYFNCRPKRDENGQYVSYSAFVDLNRENLFEIIDISTQPCLELGKLGTFDEFGTYPCSVIKEGNEALMFYAGWTRCESVPNNVAIGIAKSQDCKKFCKMGPGPVLSYSPEEPFVLSGPKIRKYNGMFYLFYIAGKEWLVTDGRPEAVVKIRLATSKDGLNWTKLNKNIISDKLGPNEWQASPDVIFSNGKYHMFFCYMLSPDFRTNPDLSYRIGYASSEDLENWKRDDSIVGITTSKFGFDDEMIAYPHVFELDGKIYMLYLGNQVGKHGFGLAELDGDLI